MLETRNNFLALPRAGLATKRETYENITNRNITTGAHSERARHLYSVRTDQSHGNIHRKPELRLEPRRRPPFRLVRDYDRAKCNRDFLAIRERRRQPLYEQRRLQLGATIATLDNGRIHI